jgi:signal transduction histidine kinase
VALEIALHRLEAGVVAADRTLLGQCMSLAAGVREKLHEMSLELHPPHLDQLGLPDALRWLAGRQRELTGTDVDCRVSAAENLRMPPQIEAACYRICQEALNNAALHAHARRVSVELVARHGRVVIRVSDDGVGFDQQAQRAGLMLSGHMGLISMEERARLAGGHFELRSAPHEGTCITASFAMDEHVAESAPARERI